MSTWRCEFVDKAGYYKSDEGHSSSISFKQNIVKRYLRGRERKEKIKTQTGTAKTSRQNKWLHNLWHIFRNGTGQEPTQITPMRRSDAQSSSKG
jgi:transposase-like protein